MMMAWINERVHRREPLTTKERLELVRLDLAELEKRIDLIEATVASIRFADEAEEEGADP